MKRSRILYVRAHRCTHTSSESHHCTEMMLCEGRRQLRLYIGYFKKYNNVTIHRKRYLIYNDTFCLVLYQKCFICPQISWEFGNFNDQNILFFFSKNASFEGSIMLLKWMIRYVSYSQSIDTTDISSYDIKTSLFTHFYNKNGKNIYL